MGTPAPHTPAREALESENQRMRARIKELESQLSDKEADAPKPASKTFRIRVSPETEDRLRSIPDHARDEVDRLARGLSYAAAEHLRSTSEVINSFADEFFGRTAQRRKERTNSSSTGTNVESLSDVEAEVRCTTDRISDATDDLVAGVTTSVHESITVPRRVIERFFDAYQNEPEGHKRRQAKTTH
jgi:hypothetical protein